MPRPSDTGEGAVNVGDSPPLTPHLEAVLIAGGPVEQPAPPEQPPFVPDLPFIRERMPSRTDRPAFLAHALRNFEDVLAYAERLEADRAAK